MARTDDEIRRDVADALIGDVRLDLEELNVEVSDGTVTLRGIAPDYYQKSIAAEVASRIKGVSAVADQLQLGEVPPVADEELVGLVLASLGRDPLVPAEQIGVRVENQIVHLSGTVDSYLAKASADDDARLVRGVKGVVNNIDVVPSPRSTDRQIASDVRLALLRELRLGRSEITVLVRDGVVILRGSVPTADLRRRAEELARRTPGVLGVDDELVVIG